MAIASFGKKAFSVNGNKIYTFSGLQYSSSYATEDQDVEGKKPSTYKKGPVLNSIKTLLGLGTAAYKDFNTVGGVASFDVVSSHVSDYTLQVPFAVCTGSANTYTVTLNPTPSSLVAGLAVCVKINVANTGASTLNVNSLGAKAIQDSKGNVMTSGKLRLNGVYTLRYDGTNFILQGEGGSGNAIASNLLFGKTASTDAGDIIGTITSKSAATYTPSASVQTIAAGQYLSGAQAISAVTVPVAKVLNDTTIAGQTGTMPNRAGDTAALASSISGTTLKLRASDGYRDGVDDNVTITDGNFLVANIVNGKTIFGLTGLFMPMAMKIFSAVSVGYCGTYIQIESTGNLRPLYIIIPTNKTTSGQYSGASVYNQQTDNPSSWYDQTITDAQLASIQFTIGMISISEVMKRNPNWRSLNPRVCCWDASNNINGMNGYWNDTRPDFEGNEYNYRGWVEGAQIWKNGSDYVFMVKLNIGANFVRTISPIYVIGVQE